MVVPVTWFAITWATAMMLIAAITLCLAVRFVVFGAGPDFAGALLMPWVGVGLTELFRRLDRSPVRRD